MIAFLGNVQRCVTGYLPTWTEDAIRNAVRSAAKGLGAFGLPDGFDHDQHAFSQLASFLLVFSWQLFLFCFFLAWGIVDTPENLWSFYISRVRKNLHMSLCFSPVGDGLWSRARRFPALVNCTTIDWFSGHLLQEVFVFIWKYFFGRCVLVSIIGLHYPSIHWKILLGTAEVPAVAGGCAAQCGSKVAETGSCLGWCVFLVLLKIMFHF